MNFKRYHVSKNLFDEIYPNIVSDTPKYKSIYVGDGDFTLSTNCPRYTTAAAMLFLLAGNVSGGASTAVNGVSVGISKTVTAVNGYVTIAYRYYPGLDPRDYQTMLNLGSTPQPYEPYSSEVWHDISHYIHNTSTDTLTTLPAVVYPNDTTATVGLKGQMEQSGTPTPTTPIQPQECGEKTGNLFDVNIFKKYIVNSGGDLRYGVGVGILPIGNYTFSTDVLETHLPLYLTQVSNGTYTTIRIDNDLPYTFTADGNTDYIFRTASSNEFSSWRSLGYTNTMLNSGSTPLPYEPYGYKIPILSNSTTTPVYLDQVQSTRRIKKLVLTGNENWYYRQGNPPNVFFFDMIDLYVVSNCGLCTHYPNQDIGNFDTLEDKHLLVRLSADNTKSYIAIRNSNFADRFSFKDYIAAQYAAGTPVCVWYALEEPTTGIVNEPLRKIGDYADEVTGITIPTIAGGDTLSIGTTLQPSEVTATYKGWHPVSAVHERESGQWD